MDADLQHPPAVIGEMIVAWQKGAVIVEAIPVVKEMPNRLKKGFTRLYYQLVGWLTDYPITRGANDFRLLDKKVVKLIQKSRETDLYIRGFSAWTGHRKAIVEYHQPDRKMGQSNYSYGKMMGLALQGITSSGIKPLRLAMLFGLVFSLLGFLFIFYVLYIALLTDRAVSGWASVMVSVLFFSGLQMLLMGILGEYLGKLFMNNKQRPGYIVADSNIVIHSNLCISNIEY